VYDWQRNATAHAESDSPAPAVGTVEETDRRLLLQVDSDENGMTWGDIGRIYFGLSRDTLAVRVFSQTIAELQCT
jgi:uncharacterized protein YwqG